MIDSASAARGRPAGGRARQARAGFTLIEMLVALAVFALAAMALLNKALEIHPALVPALRLLVEIQAATGDSEGSQRTQGVLRWLTTRRGERAP